MDKFRALQYFVAAAKEGSLAGASRRLDVSVPAISKLIYALEQNLATPLFHRSVRGLELTADGERYLDTCYQLLEQLSHVESSLSGNAARVRGDLVVGAPAHVAQHWILPALPDFHSRYPELHIDLHAVNRVNDVAPTAVDVFVLMGWLESAELVQQRIGESRLFTLASPKYWTVRGIPSHPRELERHTCLLFRNPVGTVLDLWEYARGGVKESVTVSGWLTSSHRDVILDAAIAGEGIIRATDFTCQGHVQAGLLVPALVDWEMLGSPPISVLYRPSHRRTARVRAFIDFATRLFKDLESERGRPPQLRSMEDRPEWYGGGRRRASNVQRRK